MLDINGKHVTSIEDIKSVHVQHFKKVLENRPIKNGLEEYQQLREELCQRRINNAKLNKTPD